MILSEDGWIKLHRKVIRSSVFDNEKCLKIWIWCLCKASHKEKIVLLGRQKISLKKGEFIMGGITAEETLKIARSTIYYWLSFLEAEGMVDIKKTNKYTVVTILNWDEYQEVDIKSTSNRHQIDTNKKEKKEKNKDSCDLAMELWNNFAKKNNLSTVIKLSPKRESGVLARSSEKEFDLVKILSLISESQFLLGNNSNKWKVDFDFVFCSPNNYLKILEGKYNGRSNFGGSGNQNNGATTDGLAEILQRRAARESQEERD